MPEHDTATPGGPVPDALASVAPTPGATAPGAATSGAAAPDVPDVSVSGVSPDTVGRLTSTMPPGQAPPPGWDGAWYSPPPPPGRLERFFVALWTRPTWLAPLAILGCMGLAVTYVLQNDPTDNQRDLFGPCAFKAVTGLDCPGCGGTRMVWYLLHGDLVQAGRHHLMALLAAPVLGWAFLAWGVKRIFGISLPTKRVPPVVWGGFLVASLVFAVLRNLPWEPFSWFFVR
ncbi:MAG TPA: DUF2752 domain-containing protein [Cryptosporangiaceae bacterium]|nr:DUF2752 domain-containing protein [Cryptosporangiaceae bacterium]